MDPNHCASCTHFSKPEILKLYPPQAKITTSNRLAATLGREWLIKHCYKKPSVVIDGCVTVIGKEQDERDETLYHYYIKTNKVGAEAIVKWFEEDPFGEDASFAISDESDTEFSEMRVYVMRGGEEDRHKPEHDGLRDISDINLDPGQRNKQEMDGQNS